MANPMELSSLDTPVNCSTDEQTKQMGFGTIINVQFECIADGVRGFRAWLFGSKRVQ